MDIECNGRKMEMNMNGQVLLLKNRVNTSSQIAIVGSNVCPIESLDYDYRTLLGYVIVHEQGRILVGAGPSSFFASKCQFSKIFSKNLYVLSPLISFFISFGASYLTVQDLPLYLGRSF
ncbi:hypothetical protein Hanom_Chr11g01006871 [Helianthus anomalus]